MIYYEILDGDVMGQFGVGRENGTLFTKKRLDRETTTSYDLIIMAIDQAEPPSIRRSSTTQVKSDRIKKGLCHRYRIAKETPCLKSSCHRHAFQ